MVLRVFEANVVVIPLFVDFVLRYEPSSLLVTFLCYTISGYFAPSQVRKRRSVLGARLVGVELDQLVDCDHLGISISLCNLQEYVRKIFHNVHKRVVGSSTLYGRRACRNRIDVLHILVAVSTAIPKHLVATSH